MPKSAIALFLCGVCIAIGFAVWQHAVFPEGVLLYTPNPNVKPQYTSSSLVGFVLASLGLFAIGVVVAVLAGAVGLLVNTRFHGVAKQAVVQAVGYGLLCGLAVLTEKFWP